MGLPEGLYTHAISFAGKAAYQQDSLLGYKPYPDARITERKSRRGRLVYNATYTIDNHGRRFTPRPPQEQPGRFAVFFGGSFVFGEGVGDAQTLPAGFGHHADGYRPYNYGFSGYGPQHMLAMLEQGRIAGELYEPRGVVIYVFIDHHIRRAIGSMKLFTSYGRSFPCYTMDDQQHPNRLGSFEQVRAGLNRWYRVVARSRLLALAGVDLPIRLGERHIKLTAGLIRESARLSREELGASQFVVVLYPGSQFGNRVRGYLGDADIHWLDYTGMFEPDQSAAGWALKDGHPTSAAYAAVARQLAYDVRTLDLP